MSVRWFVHSFQTDTIGDCIFVAKLRSYICRLEEREGKIDKTQTNIWEWEKKVMIDATNRRRSNNKRLKNQEARMRYLVLLSSSHFGFNLFDSFHDTHDGNVVFTDERKGEMMTVCRRWYKWWVSAPQDLDKPFPLLMDSRQTTNSNSNKTWTSSPTSKFWTSNSNINFESVTEHTLQRFTLWIFEKRR